MAAAAITPEDRKLARRARYAAIGSILTTYGYTVAGLALVQPLLTTPRQPLNWANVGAFVFALVLQGIAVYIAPRGEKP